MRWTRKVLVALMVALMAVGLSRSAAPDPVIDARKAAVTLGEYGEDGVFYRYCSGSFVDRVVVTAGHCVVGSDTVLVQTYDGRVYQGTVLAYKYQWPHIDYGLVEVRTARWLYPSLTSGDGLEFGEELYAWSGPWGLGLLLLDGTYAGRISDDASINKTLRGMHYVAMNSAGGSSGSVIVNEYGRAEAILVGGFGEDSRSLRLTGALVVELP